MASGGHLLQQQKQRVEEHLKILKNEELKEICKAYHEQVSGVKSTLQSRCQRVLNDIVRRGDAGDFEKFKSLAGAYNIYPRLPSLADSSAKAYPSPAHQSYNMGPRVVGGSVQGRLNFKPSPFYEILEPLIPLQDLPGGPEMKNNRHTVKANCIVKPEIAAQIRSDTNLKIFLYCGAPPDIYRPSQVDIAFPNQIEVKINDQEVKHNFKGMKNKAGTTKPADITSLLRKFNNHQNTIQVTYALTQKPFAYTVYLVRQVTADKLVERIRRGNVIPRDKVLRDMNKANADPDIAATSVRMSLKDPVSTVRITLPVRSSHCTHYQCFDGAMFLQLQDQAPQWTCPVCSKPVSFESLCVDKYFEDILNRTATSIEKVDIEPNGNWKVIREEEEVQPNGTSSKARASYDDDFDDLVELDQPTSKPINGIKKGSFGLPSLSPLPGQSFNTPPLSSREPSLAQSSASVQRPGSKRPFSAIIDLTNSSDDDDPPRPAKRQSTAQRVSFGSNTNSYNTPTSIPDQRYYQQQSSFNLVQADNYRPGSNQSYNNWGNGPTNNFTAQNSASPNPGSPFAPPAWPAQHSRPPTQQQQLSNSMHPPSNSFALRQPSTQNNGSTNSSLRLPPMQTHQPPSPLPDPWQNWDSTFDYSFTRSPEL